MQKVFVEKLKMSGWNPIHERVWDNLGVNQVDVFAYNYRFDSWFCFELKNDPDTQTYTKALRQMIRYRESNFKYPTEISCLIVPRFNHSNYNYDAWIERFFWRFGFGVGDLSTMKVHFVNGQNISIVDLQPGVYRYYSPTQQMTEIRKKVKNSWGFEDADD